MKPSTTIPPEEILPTLMRSNMLRMILTKHIELNKSADSKANILMTAASIVIAVILANFRENQQTFGMLLVLLNSLLAIFFAIWVILPKPYHRKSKKKNLLYFRSFKDLSEDEYVADMKDMLKNSNEIYEQYIRDIYQYGTVTLSQKYRLLTAGLLVFLLGLVLGGIDIFIHFLNIYDTAN